MTQNLPQQGGQQPPKLSQLTGPQKAATFLLALPANYVQLVFDRLEEPEITILSQAMASLGKVKAESVEGVFAEFMTKAASTRSLIGSMEATKRLLIETLGEEKAKMIISELRGPEGRTIWDKLCNINVDTLVNFLKNEHPQTIAIILSQLKASHVATVLPMLPRELAMEVIMRALNMGSVQDEIMRDVESTLRKEFMNTMTLSHTKDPYQVMAEIFNSFDRATETSFMEELEEKDEKAAEYIKSLMFTFDDLHKIDDFGIQQIIRKVDSNKLLIALRGTEEKTKELFFRNMSERAAKLMQEDLAEMRPVRLKDVEQAQASIVQIAKDMIDGEEIIFQSEDSKEEYI